MDALNTLEKFFGYSSFRGQQEKIIEAVLQKKDCLVVMPTGSGKSLCYQLPALMMDGLTVIISPLIALMKDQVDAMRLNGIDAAFINSTQTPEEQQQVMKDAESGKIKLLYVAPERLNIAGSTFLNYLQQLNVSLFAVDEAHCISHWGPDFRPDYLTLSQLKTRFQSVPVIALTATADKVTREDIVEQLGLTGAAVFISSFDRPNIRYLIARKKYLTDKLVEYISMHSNESGIIYCFSRQNTETLCRQLKEKGVTALPYHAGMENDARRQNHDLFKKDEVKIMVATIAFGMGIDKSNVRYIVHTTMPQNIEGYYQETGRAGRDGLASEALLFFSPGDMIKLRMMVRVEGNREQTQIMQKKLKQMEAFCETNTCRRKQLLNYFDEEHEGNCGNCDVCLGVSDVRITTEGNVPEAKKPERNTPVFDGTQLAQKALLAAFRLKGRFGINYIIDWLRGSKSKKIWREHTHLNGFGGGFYKTVEEWHSYIEELIDLGYLEKIEQDEYSNIRVTKMAAQVMFQNKKVMLHEAPAASDEVAEMKKLTDLTSTDEMVDKDLFEELRALRSQIAKTLNVPAFVVFNDVTLTGLATTKPHSMDELKQIEGFGEIKIQKFGEQFLNAIAAYINRKAI